MSASPYLERIERALWPRGESRDVWAILDGARDRRVFSGLLNSYINYSCLYSGALTPEMELAAPYLAQLEYQDRSTRDILNNAWGNSWGVFLKCDTSLQKLRRHLRGFLVVRGPRGRLVFRYYDPRVLRVYLPTCTTEELATVFGPIQTFWMEGDSPETLLQFSFDRKRLVTATLPLAAAGAKAT